MSPQEYKHLASQTDFARCLDHGAGLAESVEIARVGVISEAMRRADGNQVKAARLLKIHRNTLWRALIALGLPVERSHWRAA